MIGGSNSTLHAPLLKDWDNGLSVNRTTFGIIHDSRAVEKTARGLLKEKPLGNDLLSQEVALQVPSALTDLTAGLGM